jgi:hypothetical protein
MRRLKPKGFIESSTLGVAQGRGGGMVGRMDIRGECGFSSLMKQNKKAKICFVICFAGFFFLKNFCYEVFAKQKKKKESSKYYSSRP